MQAAVVKGMHWGWGHYDALALYVTMTFLSGGHRLGPSVDPEGSICVVLPQVNLVTQLRLNMEAAH